MGQGTCRYEVDKKFIKYGQGGDEMFEIYDVVLIPLIMGIVELFKKAGVSRKILPFIALVIGIVVGVVYVTDFDWKQGVLVGAMLGLSSSGLYSSSKNTLEKSDE